MGRTEGDPIDAMLSWRFKAGGFGLLALVAVALEVDQRGWRDPFLVVTLAFPVGMCLLMTGRYLRARRDLQVRGLWPEDQPRRPGPEDAA